MIADSIWLKGWHLGILEEQKLNYCKQGFYKSDNVRVLSILSTVIFSEISCRSLLCKWPGCIVIHEDHYLKLLP